MKQIVCKINETVFSPEFVSEHRKKEQYFTRKRSLTFPHLISFMLNMVNGSVQSELSRFFQIVHDKSVTLDSVTPAAFCKARKKFSHTAFKALNTCLIKIFYESSVVRRWNGFRLLAVDGSVTILPVNNALFKYFGKTSTHAFHPSVRLSQLYDVCNKLSVDVQIAPHTVGEIDLAVRHLNYAEAGDLILYDRGYPAVWLFILHQQKNIDFCARVTVSSSNIVKDFVSSGKKDAVLEFPCTEKSLRRCRKMGLPTSPIAIRLVRIELEDGNFEVLMTSLLDGEKFSHRKFKELYHQRWFVEEDYKLMKSRLEIENFSGLSVEAIQQDIHAKVLTKNIAAVAVFEADVIATKKHKHRKRKYKINFTYALSQIKDNIVRFTLAIAPPCLAQLLICQISTAVNAYRPERKFERIKDKMRKRRKRHYTAYKRVG